MAGKYIIRNLLKEKGISVEQFADGIGKSLPRAYEIIRAKNLRLQTLETVANYLKVDLSEILPKQITEVSSNVDCKRLEIEVVSLKSLVSEKDSQINYLQQIINEKERIIQLMLNVFDPQKNHVAH